MPDTPSTRRASPPARSFRKRSRLSLPRARWCFPSPRRSWNPRRQTTEFFLTFKRLRWALVVRTDSVQESRADAEESEPDVAAVAAAAQECMAEVDGVATDVKESTADVSESMSDAKESTSDAMGSARDVFPASSSAMELSPATAPPCMPRRARGRPLKSFVNNSFRILSPHTETRTTTLAIPRTAVPRIRTVQEKCNGDVIQENTRSFRALPSRMGEAAPGEGFRGSHGGAMHRADPAVS
jgi:hypothetical protein